MIEAPWFYVLAVPAVLIAGISKAGFGGGVGVMAVPLMSLAVAPQQAAAVMLPILCLMDLFGVWAYRRRWDGRNLRIILPGALVGIAIGAATFRHLDAGLVRMLIGLVAVGFALDYWLRPRAAGPARAADPARGGFWGMVAGFTSFVAHAGGPPISVYLLPQRLDRTLFVGTTVVFFITINYVKLIPYGWLGQLHGGNLTTSLVLAPLAPLGMWLGLALHRRVSDAAFYRICYGLLLATGAKLLYDGVPALLS
ncbi:MAG: sulfite exporter TauE/SafE family protein [Alphaproteobacteria bacterium]